MRFIIRDLLWLTLVVAVGMGTGWRTERRDLLTKQSILIQQQQDAIIERKFVQAENRALAVERDELRGFFESFRRTTDRLGLDFGHMYQAARVASKYPPHDVKILVERRSLEGLRPQDLR